MNFHHKNIDIVSKIQDAQAMHLLVVRAQRKDSEAADEVRGIVLCVCMVLLCGALLPIARRQTGHVAAVAACLQGSIFGICRLQA